ncbi:hypothetical protein Tsubulata_025506 [Turnera subulata]|uniref:RRM domain-containing protein n=1 Tax=Turnera subulata TaxID=218843 RepID=A0A9Q0F7V3_9ROSI|nr:hypothetical protein Tsubulata_025506 [Turnera subulata]
MSPGLPPTSTPQSHPQIPQPQQQPPSANNPSSSTQTHSKHSFFSKWSRQQVQRAIGNTTVANVFIPSKTSRSGKRFGFVRFRNGGDIQRILADLNKYQVGGTPAPSQTQPGIVFSPPPDTLSWLTRCAFGALRKPQDSHAIQELFTLHGVSEVTVSQVGRDSVLVCFPSTPSMAQFCLEGYDWVKDCFWSFEPWKQGLGPVNRTCWISVRGIPLQAWCKEFFTLVALFYCGGGDVAQTAVGSC